MGEVVNIHIGGAGVNIGLKYWETICEEHSIDVNGVYKGDCDLQLEKIDNFFEEIGGKYVPRAIFYDVTATESIRGNTPLGKLCKPDSFIKVDSAHNNFAIAHYHQVHSIEICMETIRREVESCDYLHALQFTNSFMGGTGSGALKIILANLREEFNKTIISTCSILPSTPNNNLENYNCVLGLSESINNSTALIPFDNKSIEKIYSEIALINNPGFEDLNKPIADFICSIHSCLRFPGQLNADLNKLFNNLIPIKNKKIILPGYGPFTPKEMKNYKNFNISDLISDSINEKNMLISTKPHSGHCISSSFLFRGKIPTQSVLENINEFQNKFSKYYTEFLPFVIQSYICDIPPIGSRVSVSVLNNSSSITEKLKAIKHEFTQMFIRKAFLHNYTGEGMDEMEFIENESNLNDLINEYETSYFH